MSSVTANSLGLEPLRALFSRSWKSICSSLSTAACRESMTCTYGPWTGVRQHCSRLPPLVSMQLSLAFTHLNTTLSCFHSSQYNSRMPSLISIQLSHAFTHLNTTLACLHSSQYNSRMPSLISIQLSLAFTHPNITRHITPHHWFCNSVFIHEQWTHSVANFIVVINTYAWLIHTSVATGMA